jgi:alpha-1,2-mannosyltransferase
VLPLIAVRLEPRSLRLALVGLAALIIGLALAVPEGLHQRIGQDFAVFWQAGRNFLTGAPLYHAYQPGARPFKYPPFAALVFAPLGLFSLQVAGVLASLLNLGLWVAAIYLTRDILARTFPERNASALPLALAVVLTAQFFLDNFHHAQVNGLTLVLVLFGIREYLRQRDWGAAVAIVGATAIKITPIFFTAWLVIRGRRRTLLAVSAVAAACVLLPLLIRGPSAGTAELVEYYHVFLEGHQHGDIDEYSAGQNLAALVNRMTRPGPDEAPNPFRYLPASAHTAQRVYQVLWVTVLAAFLIRLVTLRRRDVPVSAFEITMVFLTGLLLSPITFTTHLVPLLFAFATALSVRPRTLHGPGWAMAGLLGLAMAASGLSGRDLVGKALHHAIWGYSVFAWTMVLLLLAAVALAGRRPAEPQPG